MNSLLARVRRGLVFALVFATSTCTQEVPTQPIAAITAASGRSDVLAIVSGNNQTGVAGAVLSAPLLVRLTHNGKAVKGAQISFTTTGGGQVSPATATTDAQGQASVSWTLGKIAGANTATGSTRTANSVTFTALGMAGPPAQFTIVSGNNQTGIAGSALANPLVVSVADANGNHVNGATVLFAITGGSGSLGTPAATTDANGAARTTWTLGTHVGANAASATVGTLPSLAFAATGTAGAPAKFTIVTGNGQTGVVATPLALPLVVRVADANDNAVSGTTVTFAVTGGGGSPDHPTAVTDIAGRAQTGWTLGTLSGPNTLTASATGLQALTFTATATAGAATTLSIVAGNNQTGAAGAQLGQAIVVAATDQHGNAVSGATVTFAVTLGGGGLQPAQATTDATGRASSSWTLGPTAGSNTANATVSGAAPVTFSATGAAGAPALLVKVSGDGQSAVAGRTLAQALVLRVTDAHSNVTRDVAVTFAVTAGGGTLGTPSATTNANGLVSTTWTLGPLAGTNTATATVTGLAPASFTATATTAPAVDLTILSGDGQAGVVGTTLPGPLVILATEASGDPKKLGPPVAGVPVHFSVVQGGGTISTATAITDAQGQASTTLTLGTAAGTNKVQASVAGGTTTPSFTETAAPPGPFAVTVVSGQHQSGLVGTTLGKPLAALVSDANGAPVSGAAATFTVSTGGGSVGSPNAVTDANGVASTTWTLGSTIGFPTVQALVTGLAPATFSAASVPPILIDAGDHQVGVVGLPLPQAVVVRTAGGLPVNFFIVSGGGSVSPSQATTNPQGFAQATWTLGASAGANALEASFPDFPGYEPIRAVSAVHFSATGVAAAGPATSLVALSGNNQTGGAGFPLAQPVVVRAVDANGIAVAGVSVAFNVTGGGGQVQPASIATDGNGRASTSWTLGATIGPNTLEASAAGLPPVTFVATGVTALTLLSFSGDQQTGIIGTTLPQPLVVQALRRPADPRDPPGPAVSGVTISFVVTAGGGTVSTPAVVTDASGFASVSWRLGPTPGKQGTDAVEATALGAEAPVSFTATAAPPGPFAVTVVSGQHQSGLVGTTLGKPLAALVSDANGAPVSGAAVTFTVSTGGGSVGSPSAVTDANGIASTTWTLGSTIGFPTVQALVTGLAPATFSAASVPPILIDAGDHQVGAVGVPLPQPVIVRTARGLPVNFIVVSGGGSVSPGQATTDPQGFAQATWTLGASTGANALEASFPDLPGYESIRAISAVHFSATGAVAGPATSLVALSGDGQMGGTGATLLVPIVVQARDAGGIGVSGVEVTFAAADGGSVAPTVATTDAVGRASTAWTLGPGVGAQTLSASASGLGPVTLGATTIAPSRLQNRGPDTESISVGTTFSFEVMVLDANGGGMPGMPVSFVAVSGSGTIAPALVRTDPAGAAKAEGTPTTAGTYVFQAEVPGLAPVTLTIVAAAGPPASLTIASGNGQSGRYGTTLPQPIVAHLTDGFGNPVAGIAVTFAVSGGGGTVSAPDPVTDASGKASVEWTLGPAPGANTVTASAAGVPSITFTATATAGLPAVLVVASGDGQQGNIGRALAQPLVAVVADANGYGVAGQSVTFQVTSGSGAVASTTVTTDAAGQGTTTWTLGPDLGTQTVTAASGALAPVTFNAEAFGPTLSLVSGNNQSVVVGTSIPVTVRARDLKGTLFSGVTIDFAITNGGGSIADASVQTDANGLATTSWTVVSVGANRLSVSAPGTQFFVDATGVAGPPSQVRITSGDGQTAQAGTTLGSNIVAQVVDAQGNAVSGVPVQFTTTNGGSVSLSPAATDAAGRVSVEWTLGPAPGTQALQIEAGGVPTVSVTATADPLTGPAVAIASGNGQMAPAGTTLPQPISVVVVGSGGAPIPGMAVTFTVMQGGGLLTAGTVSTDGSGVARTRWTLGSLPGNNTVRASAVGLPVVYFNARGN